MAEEKKNHEEDTSSSSSSSSSSEEEEEEDEDEEDEEEIKKPKASKKVEEDDDSHSGELITLNTPSQSPMPTNSAEIENRRLLKGQTPSPLPNELEISHKKKKNKK